MVQVVQIPCLVAHAIAMGAAAALMNANLGVQEIALRNVQAPRDGKSVLTDKEF